MEPAQIKRLDEAVVNRIAAGEIIQRPANALKEMIENSLDAKANNIQVVVKSGGLKSLQIQDNGTGIRKEDLGILCERFTTSKLQTFEDLTSIVTYGFRGEALASISHVAHLSIQTKTANDKCAYKAQYKDGKLKDSPKACAGNQGTIITVDDLFYNVPQRRQTLKTSHEEFQRIYEVVSKYAIHNSHVGFVLKKFGELNSIRTSVDSNTVDNIRLIFGNSIAKELMVIEINDDTLRFKMKAYITNANYSIKKGIFLLFINHRLVESAGIKSAIDELYSTYLPMGNHPFIYMSLELDPTNVDVNVHPTKHEVHFLHEEAITEKIKDVVEEQLLGNNASRAFYTQSRLPYDIEPRTSTAQEGDENKIKIEEKAYAKDQIRIDGKDQKIQRFFGNTTQKLSGEQTDETLPDSTMTSTVMTQKFENSDVKKKETKLTSILTMRKKIEENCNVGLRKILSDSTFIGVVDRSQVVIQQNTKLYLCDTVELSKELFYQFLLYDFANFGTIKLDEPLSLYELAMLGINSDESGWTPEDGPKEELAEEIVKVLVSKALIMREYYNLFITDQGMLERLPLLLNEHSPSLCFLPIYILRLATEVNWESERECFQAFSQETADFYSKISLSVPDDQWKWSVEHILYPAIKQYLLPPSSFLKKKVFVELANLPDLYKVFERC